MRYYPFKNDNDFSTYVDLVHEDIVIRPEFVGNVKDFLLDYSKKVNQINTEMNKCELFKD